MIFYYQVGLINDKIMKFIHFARNIILGDHKELYERVRRRIILAYVFLLFPSITYGLMYMFFLADELTDFGSISMGIVGFKAVFCTFFSPPVMGKFE